jgi:hypothetical protein
VRLLLNRRLGKIQTAKRAQVNVVRHFMPAVGTLGHLTLLPWTCQ